MSDLIPEEIPLAERLAFARCLVRGAGKIPPYDSNAAASDFCDAAGMVVAMRGEDPNIRNWDAFLEARKRLIMDSVLKEVQNRLDSRGRGNRDQATDNSIFVPLREATVNALHAEDYSFAIKLFDKCLSMVRRFEEENNCEVHKGGPTFNVALAYLGANDFPAAMHYFELAGKETIATTKEEDFDIYSFDLFGANFWQSVGESAVDHPIPIYQEFWGKPFDAASAAEDCASLQRDVRLAYIIAVAERNHLRHLEQISGWNGVAALRISYWRLASDLARLLEVEAKRNFKTRKKSDPPDTLLACLEQGFHQTAHGDISQEVQTCIPSKYPRKEDFPGGRSASQLYEAHFDNILAEIKDVTQNANYRIALSMCLLGFTRNQVAHKIDETTKLFNQFDDAKFLVDLFITLCRTDEWKCTYP